MIVQAERRYALILRKPVVLDLQQPRPDDLLQLDRVDGNVAAGFVRSPAAVLTRARRAIELNGDGRVFVLEVGPRPDKGVVSAVDGHVSPLRRRYLGDPGLDLLRGAIEAADICSRPEPVAERPVHRVGVPHQYRADQDQESQHNHEGHEARRQRPQVRGRTAAHPVEERAQEEEQDDRAENHGDADGGQHLDAERPTFPVDARHEAEAERDDQDRDDRHGRQEQANDQEDGKQHVPQQLRLPGIEAVPDDRDEVDAERGGNGPVRRDQLTDHRVRIRSVEVCCRAKVTGGVAQRAARLGGRVVEELVRRDDLDRLRPGLPPRGTARAPARRDGCGRSLGRGARPGSAARHGIYLNGLSPWRAAAVRGADGSAAGPAKYVFRRQGRTAIDALQLGHFFSSMFVVFPRPP